MEGSCSSPGLREVPWDHSIMINPEAYSKANVLSSPEISKTIAPGILQQYIHAALNLLSLLLIFNIFVSFAPLMRKKDDVTDIALTPSQRALLGLDPRATPPATPTTQYITPPRYSHSSTSRNGSQASRRSSNADSPVSQKGSPSIKVKSKELQFSPAAGTIWHKSPEGPRDDLRRNSYGSPSPLGSGFVGKDSSFLGFPSTPSPSTGRGASVGLNNKWLYERGRVSSGNRGYHG